MEEVVLGTDKTNEIISQCHEVAAQWWHLGIRLGVLYSTLQAIEAGHNGDVVRCLSELISTWLRRAKGDVEEDMCPTWRSLCVALSHINGPLAETIARQHGCNYINPIVSEVATQPGADPPAFLPQSCGCGRCTVQGWATGRVCQNVYNERRPPLLVVDPSNPQVTDLVRFVESYDRHADLCAETSKIIDHFDSVSLMTWGYFEKFNNKTAKKMAYKLRPKLVHPFPMISSIDELQIQVHSLKLSWFNFEPLHFLAKEFVGLHSAVIESWDCYIECFSKYCKQRSLEEYKNIFFQTNRENVFILEVDEHFNKFTLSDIEALRKSLSSALKFPSVNLHLVTVRTGSLFIYFHYGYSNYLMVFQSLSAQQLGRIASIKCYRILSLVDFYDQFKYENIQEYCHLEEAVLNSSGKESLSTSLTYTDKSLEEMIELCEQLRNKLDKKERELKECKAELEIYKKQSHIKDVELSKERGKKHQTHGSTSIRSPSIHPPSSVHLSSSRDHSEILFSNVTVERSRPAVSRGVNSLLQLARQHFIDCTTSEDSSAILHQLCSKCHYGPEVVKLVFDLIKIRKCDPLTKDYYANTILHRTLLSTQHYSSHMLPLIYFLIDECGIDISSVNKDHCTWHVSISLEMFLSLSTYLPLVKLTLCCPINMVKPL